MEAIRVNKDLIKKAKKSRGLRAKICYQLKKHDSTVYRWLNGDYENMPPAANQIIREWFKSKGVIASVHGTEEEFENRKMYLIANAIEYIKNNNTGKIIFDGFEYDGTHLVEQLESEFELKDKYFSR